MGAVIHYFEIQPFIVTLAMLVSALLLSLGLAKLAARTRRSP